MPARPTVNVQRVDRLAILHRARPAALIADLAEYLALAITFVARFQLDLCATLSA